MVFGAGREQVSHARALVISLSTDAVGLTLVRPENAQKIVVSQPVVELDGDEMTRIIWKKIREEVRSSLSTFPQSIHFPFTAAHPPLSSTGHQVL